MCQAYEAERNFIISGENRATLHGFLHALNGGANVNPIKWGKYDKEAWQHGYNCFKGKLLPWAMEQLIVTRSGDPDYERRDKVRERFKRTGYISPALKALAKKKGWIIT